MQIIKKFFFITIVFCFFSNNVIADSYSVFTNGYTQTVGSKVTMYKNFFYGQTCNTDNTCYSVVDQNLLIDRFCIRSGSLQSSNSYQDISLMKNETEIATVRLPESSPVNTVLCSDDGLNVTVEKDTDYLSWKVYNNANVNGSSILPITYFKHIDNIGGGGGDIATSTILAIMDDNMASTTLAIEQATSLLGFFTLLIFLTIFFSFIYTTFIGVKQKPKHYE